MKLYESGEDYLEAVLMLQKKNGMVRSVDLARHMEVSKPSFSRVIQYNSDCSWRASFPSRKSGVFCCHFFGDDPVVCRCRSPPPFDSPVNHP